MSALRKVLVVDDDPVVRKSFNRVLTNKGYAVITAANAQEALSRMQQEEMDLVVTDIKMPGMSGLELAEEVRARRPWTPVVIVTGYGSSANEDRAKAAGVSAFLRKPLSPELIEGSAAHARPAAAQTGPERAQAPMPVAEAPAPPRRLARDLALFFAAPFIGLAYAVFLPIVGLGALAWVGVQALAKSNLPARSRRAFKYIGMSVAAPFVGLAYIVLLPLLGTVALAWIGVGALVGRGAGK